jgi:GNAT superfamily N-acetyltransferase
MTASNFKIVLLADRPDLAGKWAELHWREWGNEPGREELSWWVADAAKAVERTQVPAAVVAVGPDDEVLGGIGMHQFDPEERPDRSPWVVGVIVRPDRRGQGIGHAMMASMEAWAAGIGIEQAWVATEDRAVGFYKQCGWEPVEQLMTKWGEMSTILTKHLYESSAETQDAPDTARQEICERVQACTRG